MKSGSRSARRAAPVPFITLNAHDGDDDVSLLRGIRSPLLGRQHGRTLGVGECERAPPSHLILSARRHIRTTGRSNEISTAGLQLDSTFTIIYCLSERYKNVPNRRCVANSDSDDKVGSSDAWPPPRRRPPSASARKRPPRRRRRGARAGSGLLLLLLLLSCDSD